MEAVKVFAKMTPTHISKIPVPECLIHRVGSGAGSRQPRGLEAAQLPQAGLGRSWSCFLSSILDPYSKNGECMFRCSF